MCCFVQLLLESSASGRVVVLMGSTSDMAHCEKIKKACASYGIPCFLRVTSAHKGPDETLRIKGEYEGEDFFVIADLYPAPTFVSYDLLSFSSSYSPQATACPLFLWRWPAEVTASGQSCPETRRIPSSTALLSPQTGVPKTSGLPCVCQAVSSAPPPSCCACFC